MNDRLRALNRFGIGARTGERSRTGDPRRWLRDQLDGAAPKLAPPAGASAEEIGEAMRAFRLAQGNQGDRVALQQARQRLVRIGTAESRATLTQRVTSERPFVERLVAFWSNHLCVSAGAKFLVVPLAGSYERDVIRAHVLGKFEDMVMASAKHPAMLYYLDNFQSIGPNSRGANFQRRGGNQRGLNENYARELLELHTLGVNGGYTQQDVLELARLLTGWTVGGIAGPGAVTQPQMGGRRNRRAAMQEGQSGALRFVFQPLLHEPGQKTILGVKYGDSGAGEGERAIRALCRHPSTATFVAGKLVAHFVADEPPPAAVERVANVFRETGGDLRDVARALIELPEAWDPANAKFRAPQDWVVAVLRALNATEVNDGLVGALRQLRHPLWSPQAPKGFGDTTREWADPDSLLNRAELARTIARRMPVSASPAALLDVVDTGASDPLRVMLADDAIDARERVALALASPAFQWR